MFKFTRSSSKSSLNQGNTIEEAKSQISSNFPLFQHSIISTFINSDIETRHGFLKQLLINAPNSDISFIYNFVSKAPLKIDFIAELPQELSIQILAFLAHSDPHSLKTISLVSKKWKKLLDDQELWRRACVLRRWLPVQWKLNKYIAVFPETYKKIESVVRYMIWAVPSFRKIKAPWKSVFIDHVLTERNWSIGHCMVQPVRKSSRERGLNTVDSFCISFDDCLETAVSVTNDGVAHGLVWNMKDGRTLSRLAGHQGPISAVKVGKTRIVTGGVDNTLRIWKVDEEVCINTLRGHEGEINCLQFDDDVIITGSQDKTVRVWSIETGECKHVLTGHEEAVTCLQFTNELIATGSSDGIVILWSRQKSYEKLDEIIAHNSNIYCLHLDEQRVITGAADHTIKIFELTGKCIKTLKGHSAAVVSLQSDKKRVVSGSVDQSIKVWSYATGSLLYSLDHHKSPLWHIKFDSRRLISSSFDQTVLQYNFSGLTSLSDDEKNQFGLDVNGDMDLDE